MAGTISGVITAVLLVLFVAGWAWAWSSRRKPAFDAAARMPLDDEPVEERAHHDAPHGSPDQPHRAHLDAPARGNAP